MLSVNVTRKSYGTAPTTLAVCKTKRSILKHPTTQNSVASSRSRADALTPPTPPGTATRDAESKGMVLSGALAQRRLKPLTPLHADAWCAMLADSGLTRTYQHIPSSITHGFQVGVPAIHTTYTPDNKVTTLEHVDAFQKIADNELRLGRWLGPYTKGDIEAELGPFQSSPIFMVPKLGKFGKFRLVQNYLHPHRPYRGICSINSAIDSTLYPCYWDTFATTCRTIWSLPPGSQGAVRDLSEVY